MNEKPQYPEPPPPYSTAPQPGFPDGRYPPGTRPPNPPRGGVPVFPMAGYPPQLPTMVMGGQPPGYPSQPPTMVMGGQPPVSLAKYYEFTTARDWWEGSEKPYECVTSVTVLNIAQWGPYPMQITCPRCSAQIMTETTASPGLLTWLLSGALVFLGCWLGCCLIPCCIPECQDIEHRCPNCKNHLGTFRRM